MRVAKKASRWPRRRACRGRGQRSPVRQAGRWAGQADVSTLCLSGWLTVGQLPLVPDPLHTQQPLQKVLTGPLPSAVAHVCLFTRILCTENILHIQGTRCFSAVSDHCFMAGFASLQCCFRPLALKIKVTL